MVENTKVAPEPKAEYETWTPAMAETALQKNMINRTLRPTKVDQYARDMLAGRWNHSAPIVFDSEGKLIDGQHRLNAQIKADMKMTWLVVRGVPPETQTTIDTGINRSIADILHFGGEKTPQLLAAVSRLAHLIANGRIKTGRYAVSVEEIMKTLDDHPEIRLSTEIASWARTKGMTPIMPSVLGAAHWMIARVNGVNEANAFIHRIATLSGEEEGSPVLALARRANEIKRQQQRVATKDWLAMVIKAWNYDAINKKVSKLAIYSKTGEYVLPDVTKREIPLEEPDDNDDQ